MKNIKLYLLFSFGLAWLICLALWLSGGLIGNRGLLLSLCMLCPALAVFITKRITKEGWGEVGFRPRLRRHFGAPAGARGTQDTAHDPRDPARPGTALHSVGTSIKAFRAVALDYRSSSITRH